MDCLNQAIGSKNMETKMDANSVAAQQGWTFLTKSDVYVSINDSHCVMEGNKQQWKCHECNKMYTRKHNLVTHIMSHAGIKPYSCTECGKSFLQVSHLQTHMSIHQENKSLKCDHCGRGFAQLTHLKRHLLLHQDQKPYTCELCSRGFAYPSELRKHLDKHREADECRECGKEVPPDKMQLHLVKKHKVQNGYQLTCNSCEQVFTHPANLQEHIERMHKDDLKHECKKCGMKFREELHLKSHVPSHKNSKAHSCLVCGRSFTQKGNMERHMLIHSKERQFECEICGKKFYQLQVLKIHKTSHSSEKLFTCKICGKSLSRNINLKAHLALHMNKKPYKCSVCNNTFNLKGNLYRHQKDKHGRVIYKSDDSDQECIYSRNLVNGGPEIRAQHLHNGSDVKCDNSGNNVPLSLLGLQSVNGKNDDVENSMSPDMNESFMKCNKRRKGSPKRLMKSSGSTPPHGNANLGNNFLINSDPHSPDKPGTCCSSNPLTGEPSTSNIEADMPSDSMAPPPSINTGLSPIATSDLMFSGGFSTTELTSPYFNSVSSSVFPHFSASYPSQTAVSNLRPVVPNDPTPRHFTQLDVGVNCNNFLPLSDPGFGMVTRNNEVIGAKLQFIHGEIDELVNKLHSYSSDKANALHVAVNELAGLHMPLSPPFNDTTGSFLT